MECPKKKQYTDVSEGMAMDIEKRNKRQYQWIVENKERISMLFPKGTKGKLETVSKKLGISKSEFVRQAIQEKIDTLEK